MTSRKGSGEVEDGGTFPNQAQWYMLTTLMVSYTMPQIKNPAVVIDTNVLLAAMKSRRGASFKLFTFIGRDKFTVNLSVPLVLEYEATAKRSHGKIKTALTDKEIDDILDYLCSVSSHRKIFFLWRPFLKDPKDDMVLELAVGSNSVIITDNKKDFARAEERFGIRILTPKEFLIEIGEI